ncbi:MAG: DUF2012 domain-containing protein, partial [bacterium]|nr:DUF2012 domain-containing protein [bacterium]
SLAVELEDEFAPHLKPKGELFVTLKGGTYALTQLQTNRSGYYIFCDVPDGSYTLETKARYYLDESLAVDLAMPDPRDPVVKITLKPHPVYPFPEGSTLIKGEVRDPDGNVLPDTLIEVRRREETTRTTSEGTFVLYFKEIETGTVRLKVTHSLHGDLRERVDVTIRERVDVTKGKVTIVQLQFV